MKNTIRVQRAIKDLTQEELAARVNVTRQTINALEAGKYIPSAVLVLKIAKVFDQRVEDIFSLEDND
jgi:putative transcriptional regulator